MISIPVITVDGPSGTGKGTLCHRLAGQLGWHFLDSGALYRITALAAQKQGVAADDEKALQKVAQNLNVQFQISTPDQPYYIFLENQDITHEIRTETIGNLASQISVFPLVRSALLDRQRAFRQAPGLVADGRDMGTVVFPEAILKIFLEASVEERAKRRFLELSQRGLDVTLARLLEEIAERDHRDRTRAVAPLKPAEDAMILDTTSLNKEEVAKEAWNLVMAACSKAKGP